MAKRSRADSDVASQIAAFIGKSMGSLASRKDALQRELADIESQISSVRDSVMRQLGAGDSPARGRGARKAKTVKGAAKAGVKRVMSPEARAKMAASAKKR